MKKLNITKKQFGESTYFTNKYGTLKYVSESGKIFKTSKGHLLKFVKEAIDRRNSEDGKLSKASNVQKTTKSDSPTVFSNFDELKDYIESCVYDKKVGGSINGDGRLGSNIDEARIISWLMKIFKGTNVSVEKPKNRAWADVALRVGDKSYYTNIKTSNGGSDNISSKAGVWYYLSNGQEVGNWNKFQIPENIDDVFFTGNTRDDKDYFLLLMDKRNRKMLFTSLGRIPPQALVPNFSNQPFQINWNTVLRHGDYKVDDPEQQKRYVARAWYMSLTKPSFDKMVSIKEFMGKISGEIDDVNMD